MRPFFSCLSKAQFSRLSPILFHPVPLFRSPNAGFTEGGIPPPVLFFHFLLLALGDALEMRPGVHNLPE